MIPDHIAVILDGNRRFAKGLGLNPWKGHAKGVEKAREAVEWAAEKGIKYLTGYVLSIENLNRPQEELEELFDLLERECDAFTNDDHAVQRTRTKVRFAGNINLLPERIQEKIKKAEESTKDFDDHIFTLCIAYGGQQEIVDACKRILESKISPDDLTLEKFSDHLWVNGVPSPDIVIRTGGEKRLSNFLPFQSAYSEIFFIDKMWPSVTKEDFEEILEEYSKRERRYGK